MVERARPVDPARGHPDDDAELDLEIEGGGALRPDDRLAVRDHRVGELGEQERARRCGPAALGDVLAIVQADAHDLGRPGDRGHDVELVERDPDRAVERGRPAGQLLEALRIEVVVGDRAVEQRHDAIADQQAGARVLRSEVRHEAHRGPAQLGEAAALGAGLALGARDARGGARARGRRRLGAALAAGDGLVRLFGTGQASSGLVRPPHCFQKAVTMRRVPALHRQHATPQDRLERAAHLVEPGDDRPAIGHRRKRRVELAQLRLALGRRPGARTLVEDDQPAVLEVVEPALRDDVVVRAVDPRRDRPGGARTVDVIARRGRAIGVGHLLADPDVAVAHQRLDVAEGGRRAGGRRRGRGGRPDGRAGIRRLRGGEEHERRDQRDADHAGHDDDRRPVALHERRLVGQPLPLAPAGRLALPVGRDVGALLRGVDPGAPVVPAGFAPALPAGGAGGRRAARARRGSARRRRAGRTGGGGLSAGLLAPAAGFAHVMASVSWGGRWERWSSERVPFPGAIVPEGLTVPDPALTARSGRCGSRGAAGRGTGAARGSRRTAPRRAAG